MWFIPSPGIFDCILCLVKKSRGGSRRSDRILQEAKKVFTQLYVGFDAKLQTIQEVYALYQF